MSVRYTSTFKSIQGDTWRIDITDSTTAGDAALFNTDKSGFKKSYNSLTQRFDPIFSSTVNVPFIVETSTHAAFILELISAKEERIGVLIYKNSYLDFAGILINDGIEIEDQYYPYAVNLKFIDGLGRLSDKFYNTTGTETSTVPYSGRESLLGHIIKCLSWAGTMQYYTSTGSFLKCVINWYEKNHVLLNYYCTFGATNLDHKIFYEYDDKGVVTYQKVSDVLMSILQTFNARIFMANGIYHIVQAQEYTTLNIRSWTFDKTGTQRAMTFPDNGYYCNVTSLNRLAGGITKYLPPLMTVKKLYKYKASNGSDGNLLPVQTSYTTAVNMLNSLQGGNEETLHFTGNLHEVYKPPTSGAYTYYVTPYYKLQVVLTTSTTVYYLYGDTAVGNYYFTTSPSYITYQGDPFSLQWYMGRTMELDIVSGPIPAVGTATFRFIFDHYLKSDGTVMYSLPSGTFTYYDEQFSEIVEWGTVELAGETQFFANNSYNTSSTQRVELKDTLIGDGPFACSLGRFEVFNGSTWVKSQFWAWGTPPPGSTGVDINQFSLNKNINGQMVSVEVFQGSFIGTYSAEQYLRWGSKYFVPLQLDFSPADDQVTGRWFNAVIPAF